MSSWRSQNFRGFPESFHLIWRWIFEPRRRGSILLGLSGWRAEMRGGVALGEGYGGRLGSTSSTAAKKASTELGFLQGESGV
jgi:hypothetical protein